MRRFLLAPLVLIALTACGTAPPQPGPLWNVRAFAWRVRNPPAPTQTPLPGDRICLDGLAEHGGELPGAVVENLTGVPPAVLERDLFDLLDDAMDEVGIGGGDLAVAGNNAPGGEALLAVNWCDPYGSSDVFVRSAGGEVWHVIHTDALSAASAVQFHSTWLDGIWLVSQRTPGMVEQLRVWVVEPVDSGWAVTYEAQHRGVTAAGTYAAPEVERYTEGGVEYLRLRYTHADGTPVSRVYRLNGTQFVLVEDEQAGEDG